MALRPRLGSRSGVLALLATGCLTPPQGGAEAPSSSKAAPAGDGAAASSAPMGRPGIVWNGDDVNPTAKGWASCDTQPCTTVLAPVAKVGRGGSTGLEFKADGTGYLGFGWNWTSWTAAESTNVNGLTNLHFWVQIVPESLEVAPDPKAIRVGLRCAAQKNCGKEVGSLGQYVTNVTDGEWHEVVIPLGDMKLSDGSSWDAKTAWEIGLHNWAPTPRKFVVHLDDIGFD
jgi:hypothetical protein